MNMAVLERDYLQCLFSGAADKPPRAPDGSELPLRERFRLHKRNALIRQWLPLAMRIVRRLGVHPGVIALKMDSHYLAELCCEGLIEAAEGYDPNHWSKAKFITYAHWAIYRYALNHMDEHGPIIWVPANVREALSRKLRGEPQPHWNQTKPANLEHAERARHIGDLAPGCGKLQEPSDEADEREESVKLRKQLAGLSKRQQQIIRWRFGLDGEPWLTLAEVGQRLGLTKERVRQIQSRTLAILRKKMAK
jgi:RNA polymerase sigma factor (sigma-70 family)